MDRYVHFLILEPDLEKHKAWKKQLFFPGAIHLFCSSLKEATWEISRKEIGLIMFRPTAFPSRSTIQKLKSYDRSHRAFFLALLDDEKDQLSIQQLLKDGFFDYLSDSMQPGTTKAKLRIYKSLFQKDQRIAQLLENIFPGQVLHDLNHFGKYSPKRIENGVVLFTDFVDFSRLSKNWQPIDIVRKLEQYFLIFDEIIQKYHLEKIKTIGDAYMVIGGVTENLPQPVLRTCLAALEIRERMAAANTLDEAQGLDPWKVRIGVHCGPLVAGILGAYKINFDVWGDTVNLAKRAEEESWPGHITITQTVAEAIAEHFTLENRGRMEIKKRGGYEQMYFLQYLNPNDALYEDGISPSADLREKCGLPRMDFFAMRENIIQQLRAGLPSDLVYHNLNHTIGVEKAATRLARYEGLNEEETIILLTAVLYHDAGFIHAYRDNEKFGAEMAHNDLPKFGYTTHQIESVVQIIHSTRNSAQVKTLLEKIMSDADHDYFGRAEYHTIAGYLREEMALFGETFSEKEWIIFQLDYLEKEHRYFTASSISIRVPAKKKRIAELKQALHVILG